MSLPKFHKPYIPGLISLAVLSVLFVLNVFNSMLARKSFGINVAWGDDSMMKSWAKVQKQPFNPRNFRKFDNSILIGDSIKDNSVLEKFGQNIKSLATFRDTVTGYSLTFTKHTDYANIVRAIDMSSQLENKDVFFILYKDKILVWEGQSYQPKPSGMPL